MYFFFFFFKTSFYCSLCCVFVNLSSTTSCFLFYVKFFSSSCYTPVFLFLWCFLPGFTSCLLFYLTSHVFIFFLFACICVFLYLEVFSCVCLVFCFFLFFCSWKWYKQQYNPQLKYQLAYLYLSSGFQHHFPLWITWNLRFNHYTHFLVSQPSELILSKFFLRTLPIVLFICVYWPPCRMFNLMTMWPLSPSYSPVPVRMNQYMWLGASIFTFPQISTRIF